MDIDQSPSGQIIKTLTGYKAFIPAVLPPSFAWDNDLVHSLSRADYLLGQLAREGSKLPNPHLMIRPFITREAVLSSKSGRHRTISEHWIMGLVGCTRYQCHCDLSEKCMNN